MNETHLLSIKQEDSVSVEETNTHQLTRNKAFQIFNQQQLPEDVLDGQYSYFLEDPVFCLSMLRKHPEHIWVISPALFYNFEFISKTITNVPNVLNYFPIDKNILNHQLFVTIFETSPKNVFFLNPNYLRYQEIIVIAFDIYFQANPNPPTINMTKFFMNNVLNNIRKDGLYTHLLPEEFQITTPRKPNPSFALQHLLIKCHENLMIKDLETQLKIPNPTLHLKF